MHFSGPPVAALVRPARTNFRTVVAGFSSSRLTCRWAGPHAVWGSCLERRRRCDAHRWLVRCQCVAEGVVRTGQSEGTWGDT